MAASLAMISIPFAFFGLWETTLAVGAAAASIPIIIHLLNRRRYQIVTWAAMRFLLRAQKQNTRRMRLEQLLLLAVRVLAVLLIVLAMAAVMPWAESLWAQFFPEGAGFITQRTGRTHRVLVIDGSLSMSARKNGGKSAFERACDKAVEIIEAAPPGDGFNVLLLKDAPTWVVAEIAADSTKLMREVRNLRPAHGNGIVANALNMVAAKLAESPTRFQLREVYFLSDMQKASWLTGDVEEPLKKATHTRQRHTLEQIQARAQTIFVDVGEKHAGNVAVTDVTLGDTLLSTGALVPVTATVQNYGDKVRQGLKVELLVGRAREKNGDSPFQMLPIMPEPVNIKPGERVTVNFGHKFTQPGTYAVGVRVSSDDLGPDDQRNVIVTVKETIPVLLVDGKPAIDPFDTAAGYLKQSLNPFLDDGPVPRYAPLRPKVITTSQFADASESNLAGYDCIFLCDVGQLTTGQLRRLQGHLRRGGGVVISLGPASADHLGSYNRLLFDKGTGLLPAELIGVQQAPPEFIFTPQASEEAYREPPLRAFAADDDRIALRAVRIRKYVRAKLPQDLRARTILSLVPFREGEAKEEAGKDLPSADPLLLEWNPPLPKDEQQPRRIGSDRYRGKVILLTTTWNMDWNSWPGSPSYVAMVQELARLGLSGRLREHALVVGAALEEFLTSRGTELNVSLHTPDQPEQPHSLRTEGEGDVTGFHWDKTDVSGIYRMTVGQDVEDHLFAVNVPATVPNQKASESDLSRASDSQLRSAYPGWDFQLVRNLSEVRQRVVEGSEEEMVRGRMGPEIAHYALLAVLGLLLLEVVLACVFGHFSSVPGAVAPAATRRALPITVAVVSGVLFLLIAGVLLHAALSGDFLGFLPLALRSWVESWLGIPPPAPGEGTRWALEFSPYFLDAASDVWAGGAVALATAGLLFVTYLYEGPTISVVYKVLLGGLRLFLVLLTLTVLLPQLQLTFERQGWPDVVVLVDDSLSMGETDHYQDERVRQAVEKLGERVRGQLKEQLPGKIESLKRRLAEQPKRLEPGQTDRKQQQDQWREQLTLLETQLAQIDSPGWRPTRLQLAQSLLQNPALDWPQTLLNQRRMKVHFYHLDGAGRAIKMTSKSGLDADITDPGEPEQLSQAEEAVALLEPQANESRLGTAVRQVLDYFRGASVASVIVLSDGVTTREETLAQVSEYASQKGVPLFFVGIGDDHELRDLKLHDLQVEDTVYVNDRVVFEARLTGRGYRNLTVPVLLKERDKDGTEKELAREMVTVDPSGKPVRIRLRYQPDTAGEKLYIIEVVPPKEDEDKGGISYSNLRLQRTIFVQESKIIKVLYVEGGPRYEYRFIKSLLERERQDAKKRTVELKVLLIEADADFPRQDSTAISEFPFNKVELFQYDVIILGDVDPQSPRLGDRKLRDLADFVRERGGGLLMIAGPLYSPHAYRNTPLADVLPIEPGIAVPEEPAERTKGYRLELTPVGRLHPIFRFSPNDEENMEIMRTLAPMYWWADGYHLKPAAEILAVHPKATAGKARQGEDSRLPLVVQHFVGAGRCMFFGFDETWRWRFREDEIRFNQFWIQTIRYLSRSRVSRTDLRLDRQTPYRQGEPIKVTVRFPDNMPLPGQMEQMKAGMQPDVKVIVEYRPTSKDGVPADVELQTLKLAKVEGSWATYEGLLTRTREGKYRFWLSSPDVSDMQPNKQKPSAEAVVVLPPGELDRLRMDREEMTRAADISHGKFYTLATAQDLLDELPAGYRVSLNTPGPPRLLWNHWLMFLLVLGLFTAEWVLRKRKHLL